jgi:hypothetical protein
LLENYINLPAIRFLGSATSTATRYNLFDYFIYVHLFNYFVYVLFFDYFVYVLFFDYIDYARLRPLCRSH